MQERPEDDLSPTDHPDGSIRLNTLLRTVAFKEQIVEALGMQDHDSQNEEFWVDQRRTAKTRFYLLCLQGLGWDLGAYRETLDSGQAHAVADEAENLLAGGTLRYKEVREWWLNRGQFEYGLAVDRRREVERQKTSALRALFILEAGGAKYLAYSPDITAAPGGHRR